MFCEVKGELIQARKIISQDIMVNKKTPHMSYSF